MTAECTLRSELALQHQRAPPLASAYFNKVIDEGSSVYKSYPAGRFQAIGDKARISQNDHLGEESIYIQTPYFVPDASVIRIIKNAIFSGVDVRIMIPCMPDHMFVYWATLWYVGDLLRAVLKFIYTKRFSSMKSICVDGEVASSGIGQLRYAQLLSQLRSKHLSMTGRSWLRLEKAFEKDMEESEKS